MAILNKANLSSTISKGGDSVTVTNQSNNVLVTQLGVDVVVNKTINKTWAISGQVLVVTNEIVNNANFDIEDFIVKDTLSEGVSFVEGSFKVGLTSYPDYNVETGFTLPVTVGGSGVSFEMTYEIKVDDYVEVDSIVDTTNISFTVSGNQYTVTSNTASVEILHNDILLLKQATPTIVKSNDEITYKITISNNGNIKNTNLVFKDEIPSSTTFVENSVIIDGESKVGFNPTVGFNLSDLDANGEIVIEFKVTVN